MKRILILFMAGMILCICSASVFQNPAGIVNNDTALDYYDNKDYKSAFNYFQKAARAKNHESQYYLYIMYLKGKGVRRSKSTAIMWLKNSANGGFAPAQVILGIRYRYGSGVSKDLTRAYRFFLSAARSGDPDGQYFVGFLLATGKGTAKNSKKALQWFRKAKSNGFPISPTLLTRAGVTSLGDKGWKTHAGSRGNKQVRQIQTGLTKLGYDPGPIDGLFGKKTETAIRLFQKENKLVVDGKQSALLLIQIKKACDPDRHRRH